MGRIKLDNQITYDKMFNMMQVKDIVIFEDDFLVGDSKNEIFYGLVRINIESRKELLHDIGKIDINAKEDLEKFLLEFDKLFDAIEDWNNEVVYNDLETAFYILEEREECTSLITEIKRQYDLINMNNWVEKEKILRIFSTYGIGLNVPTLYEDIFDEYIQKGAHWTRVRIFRDFNSNTQELFKQYIIDSKEKKGTMICIVDNQLRDQKCALEILKCVEKIQSDCGIRMNIVGAIYSTFDNQDYINDKIYFEYITKEGSKRKLQTALAKSAYSCMLYSLKGMYQNILELSFEEAVKNKNIAYYLSSMAGYEGVTNYEVVSNWIKLLFDYKLSNEENLIIIACMTRLINLLEDEEINFSKEMLKLNTFEAFDFNINKFREPIASGDIFIYKKRIFILIGQDCDMMYSPTRDRKNGISELVTATTVNQSNIDNSVKLNSEYICISNFRKAKEAETKTLKIRYSSREFLENQILQLCQFNDEGECRLHINTSEYKAIGVEPTYYSEMYFELRKYFEALLKLSSSEKEAMQVVVDSVQSKRLMTLLDYNEQKAQNGIIEYPIRRICRLKHSYMLYLYKMYLEHQGRHPFNCMNMSRIQELQVEIEQNENIFLTVDAILSPDRDANRAHIGSMIWYVDKDSLLEAISQLFNEPIEEVKINGSIEIGLSEKIFECITSSGQKKKLQIRKVGDAVSITEHDGDSEVNI